MVGLKLCQQAIVQEGTRNVTLVNCFRRLPFKRFPAEAKLFFVCVVLTDGMGVADLKVSVVSLDDMKDIWTNRWSVRFADPIAERWFTFPVGECSFPKAGTYQVELTINGEPAARTLLRVTKKK